MTQAEVVAPCVFGACCAPYSSCADEPSEIPRSLPLRADEARDLSCSAFDVLRVTDIAEFRLPSGGALERGGRLLQWSACCLVGRLLIGRKIREFLA